jgi:hypothetical protein
VNDLLKRLLALHPGTAMVLFLLASQGPAPVSATSRDPAQHDVREIECAPAKIKVRAEDPTDARHACRGALDAIAFFTSLGITLIDGVTIEIVQRLPDAVSRSAAGCFLEARRSVVILTYAQFLRNETWFKIPVDRKLYRSLATHEVAHAIAACNFAIAEPSIQAKEYVAYVATFAAMEPALRARALSQLPGQGFDDESKITAIFYMVDPMLFGAEAYRHYLRPDNGPRFLRAVLSGSVLKE